MIALLLFLSVFFETLQPHYALKGKGLSGAYVGEVDGRLMVAGGEMTDGVPEDRIWYLGRLRWQVPPRLKLPYAMANGASAEADGRLLMLGGLTGNGRSTAMCYAVAMDSVERLPLLPKPIDRAGAAYDGTYVYLVGGQTDGEPNLCTYRLRFPGGTEWEQPGELTDTLPLRPAVCWQAGALRIIPNARNGASAVPIGSQHVLLVGASDSVWVYNVVTDAWFAIPGRSFMNTRDGGVARVGDAYVASGGRNESGARTGETYSLRFDRTPHFGTLNWIVLGAYLLGMLLLGVWFAGRSRSASGFFRAEGRVPGWAAGMSIYATMLSALTFMGIPAKAFATDWTYYPILASVVLVAPLVCAVYIPRLRRLNLTTAYEYLEVRFHVGVRLMASALFCVFMLARMALVLYLPSLALSAVTGISVEHCILMMGLVTVVYSAVGGIEAVIWADVVQGFILLGGAIACACLALHLTDGGAGANLDLALRFNKMRLFDWGFSWQNATFWVAILGGMANNLISLTSDQTVVQRYLTTPTEREARRSVWTNATLCVAGSIVFYVIGTALFGFYHTRPALMDITMESTDQLVPFFVMTQLPSGLAGLLIAAIFAATMSTLSSSVNSFSTAIGIDFVRRLRPSTSDRSLVRLSRLTSVLGGAIGVALALLTARMSIASMVDTFNAVLGLLTSGLGGLFVMGMLTKRIGARAAAVGFACGVAAVFWLQTTSANVFLYGLTGLAASTAVGLLLSLIWPRR